MWLKKFSRLLTVSLTLHVGVITSASAESEEPEAEIAPQPRRMVSYNTVNGGSAMTDKVSRYYGSNRGVIAVQQNPQARGRLARPEEELDEEYQEDHSE